MKRIAAIFALLCLSWLSALTPAHAGQLGPTTNYSQGEISAAVSASSLNPYLKQYADQMGNLGRFESGGNAGIFNGSCCTGIFQLNTSNLAAYGYTRESYANASLQEQTEVWAKLTNSAMGSAPVQQLINMQKNGQTFDGQNIDGAMVMACVQLGTGNCQKMLSSGSCSGFSDINGTTICKMADKIRNGSNTKGDPNAETGGDTGNKTNNNQGDDLGGVKDKSPAECWGCEAITISFSVVSAVAGTFSDELMKPALGLFCVIFGLVVAVSIGKAFFLMSDQLGRTYSQLWSTFLRFIFVMTVLMSGSFYGSIVVPYVLSPVMGISSDLATKFGDYSAKAFGGEATNGSCSYTPVKSDNEELKKTGDAVAKTMCSVHLKMTTSISTISKATLKFKNHLTGISGTFIGIFLTLLAVMGMIALVSSLVVLSFQLVEGVIRIGFCIALFPLVFYLWVYRTTQPIFSAFMRNILYGGVLLIVASIMAGIATGMAAIMLQVAGSPQSLGTGAGEIGATAKYIMVMAALGSLAATMMSSAGPLATQMTRASQELAGSAGGAVNAMMQSFTTVAAMTGGGGRIFGALAGKMAPQLADGAKAIGGKALTNAQKVKAMTVSGQKSATP